MHIEFHIQMRPYSPIDASTGHGIGAGRGYQLDAAELSRALATLATAAG
jgi:hypothetical protein